ncbi:competence protein CoiA family protein [Streptomyces sp. NBC_01716]|uniref:competence protein CoiA family protein n=1 Tax=Streptomyces sp. NBC_01716 TaxID=2975917 RepID=UPI002E330EAC|nr:competence protein CoiA family protein [Streptomyces sp. NBC_01716]
MGQRPRDLLQCLTDYDNGQCQCALADKTPWMFVRRQRSGSQVIWVAAHLPLTHIATAQESEKHKAMKERIARSAARHGLDVQVEARSPDGRMISDVLVSGAGARVGWEAQYSPISSGSVRRRSTKARDNNIAPLWVTGDASSALIDRAPWARVDDVPWQRIASPLAMVIRGGVRHLQVWKCDTSSERPCPTTGQACGKYHSGWFLPALCLPQERATLLDELVVTSADGEHVPLRVRNMHDPRRVSYLWALESDVTRWHNLDDGNSAPPDSEAADDEPVTFTEEELDSSCRYGEESHHRSDPRPRRDMSSATGLHTFEHAPNEPYRIPSRPVQLQLSTRERVAVSRELNCPPWEIGPCTVCATPIHRYGTNSPSPARPAEPPRHRIDPEKHRALPRALAKMQLRNPQTRASGGDSVLFFFEAMP